MRNIPYQTYFDKGFGCFLGKCVGGIAGGPAEGRKELLDYPLEESMLHVALPNDDLDLQILWLEVLEEKGIYITARDLGAAFAEKVPYGSGEYGVFQRNYKSGIYPPYSGRFNNVYYANGMGCPIRSEIWACLFPGAYETAAPYVYMDGCMDHVSDSIDAERFLTCMESEAFFCDNLRRVIETARETVLLNPKLDAVVRDTLALFDAGKAWKYVRSYILRHYGHADCTNMYQNIGFVLIAMLWGGGDIRETIRLGNACGYDTDCICATAASVIGTIRGAKAMIEEDGLTDTGLNIGVLTHRRGGSIEDFSRDVCAAGISMAEALGAPVSITDYPEISRLNTEKPPVEPFEIKVDYIKQPNLVLGKKTPVALSVVCNLPGQTEALLTVTPPEGVSVSATSFVLTMLQGETTVVSIEAWISPDAVMLNRVNRFSVAVTGAGQTVSDDFGLVGGIVWKRYGPFLKNVQDLSHLPPHLPYGGHFVIAPGENGPDVIREYHLGGIAPIGHAFVDESEPFLTVEADGSAFCEPEVICTGEDLFDLAELQAYEGPHVDYLVTRLVSPEERDVELAVGHTAPFQLWLNGTYIGGGEDCRWWTVENKHLHVHLKQGENVIVLKCARITDSARYSIIPRYNDSTMRQHHDFGCLL